MTAMYCCFPWPETSTPPLAASGTHNTINFDNAGINHNNKKNANTLFLAE